MFWFQTVVLYYVWDNFKWQSGTKAPNLQGCMKLFIPKLHNSVWPKFLLRCEPKTTKKIKKRGDRILIVYNTSIIRIN